MKNDVTSGEFAIPFLQRLIQTDTCNPPGNETKLAAELLAFLQEHGIAGEIFEAGEGRGNLEAMFPGSGTRTLMFCGHLDTVGAWTPEAGVYPPHGAVLADGRMYGRGTSDMKSGLAAMLLAAVSLHLEGVKLGGDLLFLATAGEEVDSCGASLYAARPDRRKPDGLVIAEPTGSRVAVGHKGALWLRITLHGRSAHGSMPQLGLNAVEGMMEIIAFLRRHSLQWQAADPVLGSGSLSVNRIAGGIQTNVVPDRCEIDVDIRTVPPQKHAALFAELEAELAKLGGRAPGYRCELRQLLDRSVVYTDPGEALIRTALDIAGADGVCGVPYYTDGSVLHEDGTIPVLIYGPGEPSLAHQPDEWVELEAYLASIRFYRELALRFLGRAAE